MQTANRLQKLRHKLTEKEIDAILISQPENRRYLSGFDGSAGYLFITHREAVLATDFRYIEQAQRQAKGYEIYRIAGDMAEWFPKLVSDSGSCRLGFESGNITFAIYEKMTEVLSRSPSKARLVPVDGLVESLRAVKEPEEIELITKAVKFTDAAFAHAERTIHSGMSEKELAWEIEKFLREQGSEVLPFDAIVASGPNAALPHARPSTRAIKPGEPVIIDIGAKVEGYTGDLTRTFCIGQRDDTFNKVYKTVLDAQLAAIAKLKPGMTGNDVDNIARTSITKAGYGEAFGHGLGHGIGLATHEGPRLGPSATDQLVEGMVFTIEPGIYLPGWGGVRIEDDVVIKNGTIVVLSSAKKTLP